LNTWAFHFFKIREKATLIGVKNDVVNFKLRTSIVQISTILILLAIIAMNVWSLLNAFDNDK